MRCCSSVGEVTAQQEDVVAQWKDVVANYLSTEQLSSEGDK